MMDLFKDWIPSLCENKVDVFKEGMVNDESQYPAYMLNMHFSMREDTIFLADEMNCSKVHPKAQFDFYLHTIPKKKVFASWAKAGSSENAKLLMRAYGYNQTRAFEALDLLSENEIENLRARFYEGGRDKK